MSARDWSRRVEEDLRLSVPEDDPGREMARRRMALGPRGDAPRPGPSGIDWANDPEALGAELRRLRESSEPLVVKLTAGAVPEPPARVIGYVAVVRRNRLLFPVGSVTPDEVQAWKDADWWSANDGQDAFVAELRKVTR